MARIVISGYMIRCPLSGAMLAYFHYVLGFLRLGHDVIYIEESGWEDPCIDPRDGFSYSDCSYGLAKVHEMCRQFEADLPIYYVDRSSGKVFGGSMQDVRQALADADVLLNLGGVCWLDEFFLCRHRVLLDMDPFFTQAGFFASELLPDYHSRFTYGMNIGRPGCTIPRMGYVWRGIPPPVVTEIWSPVPSNGYFTTVANWGAYGTLEHEGETYGQKDVEFLKLLHLPRRTLQPLEIAMGGGESIRGQFRCAGWDVIDARPLNLDLQGYRAYIADSRGEFSVAKHAYVKTRSGWFSDRTVCYLAASKPVVIQDTGQSDWMNTGSGVVTFRTPDEAADALERVNADYASHCRAAREIALEYFDYHKVLPRLLETAPAPASKSVSLKGALV